MSSTQDFIKNEKDHYGKLYVDIAYAVDNITPFLDPSIIRIRKYTVKLPIIKKYIALLESSESESKKGGFLNLFNGTKYIDLLQQYKNDNRDDFKQLEKCKGCACLNCTVECKFDSCLGCRRGSNITSCDHKKINITLHDEFFLNLKNNNTGRDDRYKVLATLQDVQINSFNEQTGKQEVGQKYIVIENINNKERFILYYYCGISEDTYGEIKNPEEFDLVSSIFQSTDI